MEPLSILLWQQCPQDTLLWFILIRPMSNCAWSPALSCSIPTTMAWQRYSGVRGSSDLGEGLLKGPVWVSSDSEVDRCVGAAHVLWGMLGRPRPGRQPLESISCRRSARSILFSGPPRHMPLCFCNNDRVRQGSLFLLRGAEGSVTHQPEFLHKRKPIPGACSALRDISTFYKVKSLNERKQ